MCQKFHSKNNDTKSVAKKFKSKKLLQKV